ncbi:MAG: AAA family ATPase [Candidatus Thalassarchaeaceae archaeon]|nr:AAA family ATPase [Candidatus Thalassarchaeaceae archaeon]
MVNYVVMFVELNGGDILVKITVSGPPGSGTSTLVEKLANEYSWLSLNGGDIFRKEAKDRNLTVGQFSELCKTNLDVDKSLDEILKKEIENPNGAEIIESRLSGWWAHLMGVDCLRVWVNVSPEECARRIQKREGGNFEDRLVLSQQRQIDDKERYRILYDIDLDDMSPYSLIIDADDIGAEEVFSIVQSEIGV